MKRPLLIAAIWIATIVTVAAQPIVKSQTATASATVDAIDRASRQVTLKTSDGRVITADVDPAVRRFDALQVGDRLTVTYYESMVFEIEKPGEPPIATGTSGDVAALKTQPGEKPGGAYARQRKAAVTVEDVVREPASITVKGEQGRVLTFRISDPTVLDRVKKGDRIHIAYTEAFLVKVDPQ